MQWIWAGLALAAGGALAVQAGINAQLRVSLGHATLAALVNTLVAVVFLAACVVVTRPHLPSGGALRGVPVWQWAGGVLGGVYVLVNVLVALRLGAAALVALIVSGQLLAALILDHFGLLAFPEHALNGPRLVGAALLVAGVVLIRRF